MPRCLRFFLAFYTIFVLSLPFLDKSTRLRSRARPVCDRCHIRALIADTIPTWRTFSPRATLAAPMPPYKQEAII